MGEIGVMVEMGGFQEPAAEDMAAAIVARIAAVTRQRTLEHAVEVGRIVVNGVYQGDMATVRERGERDELYKRVAGHKELPRA